MTIFRVNVDTDLATLVQKGTRVKDKELERALKEFEVIRKLKEQVDAANKALERARAMSAESVSVARSVYTICDNRLKEKDLSKDDREELQFVRKKSYDFTVELKKAGLV